MDKQEQRKLSPCDVFKDREVLLAFLEIGNENLVLQ